MNAWPGNAQKERTSFGGLTRGQLMSRVRSKGNETTELRMASLLRAAGLSGWRRHQNVPGRPDFAWPQAKVAVFVDGCFWHGHDCGKNLTPVKNAKEWRQKIRKNKARDRRAVRDLRRRGWIVIRFWECELAKNRSACLSRIRNIVANRNEQT
jgi:DNA mismatch endonuclease (patch repair protein)